MKIRIGIVALLAGAMALVGVGCTPPSSEWQAQNQVNNFWTTISFLIVMGLCQNTTFCPLPGLPIPPDAPPPTPEG